jgi:hypothetical protein
VNESNNVERMNGVGGMKNKGSDRRGVNLWANAAGLSDGGCAKARPSDGKPLGGHPVPRPTLSVSPLERLRRSSLDFDRGAA